MKMCLTIKFLFLFLLLSICAASKGEYLLKFSEDVLDITVDEQRDVDLCVVPGLSSSSNFSVRLNCFASDTRTDATSDYSACSDFLVVNGYNYRFVNHQSTVRIQILGIQPGKQHLLGHVQSPANEIVEDSQAILIVNVGKSDTILVISTIIGWMYFISWTMCFYPQIWENWRRKSVAGMNFDFVMFNLTGFTSYSLFNVCFFFIPRVHREFEQKYPHSIIPVLFNDVAFAVHGAFCCFLMFCQCFIYSTETLRLSIFARIFHYLVWIGYPILVLIVLLTDWINLLEMIYIFSYVKLAVTLIKYTPQVWFNFQRKSTVGWSIGMIIGDFLGGVLSMTQMILLAYNYDDWSTFFSNFSKFGIGAITILFDLLFFLQHFILYSDSYK